MGNKWMEVLIGAVIVQAVGGIWLWLRSLNNKVSKEAHHEAIAALEKRLDTVEDRRLKEIEDAVRAEIEKTNRRISQWEDKLTGFARQEALNALNQKIDRMETKIEAAIEKLSNQIISILTNREK